jgi:hypothetical protein
MTLGPPVSPFRISVEGKVTTFPSDADPMRLSDNVSGICRLDDTFGMTTVSDEHRLYLALSAFSPATDKGVTSYWKTQEIWDVTDSDQRVIVDMFSDSEFRVDHRVPGLIARFGISADMSSRSSAYFVFVYDVGYCVVKPTPNGRGAGSAEPRLVRFPRIESVPDAVGNVHHAAMSIDGTYLATAHEAGYVVIWRCLQGEGISGSR